MQVSNVTQEVDRAFTVKGCTALSHPVNALVRWNTKNAGDASVAWRLIFQLEDGEREFNVRNIQIRPNGSVKQNQLSTVTTIVDGELKGNVQIPVRMIHFDPKTREVMVWPGDR